MSCVTFNKCRPHKLTTNTKIKTFLTNKTKQKIRTQTKTKTETKTLEVVVKAIIYNFDDFNDNDKDTL